MNNLSKTLRQFFEKKPLYTWENFEFGEKSPDPCEDFEDSWEKFELEERPRHSWQEFGLEEYAIQPTYVTENEFNIALTGLSQIEMECNTCKQSRPFGRQKIGLANDYSDDDHSNDEYSSNDYFVANVGSKTYLFLFKCYGCSSSKYTFFIEVDTKKGRIRKIGQNPPWPINLDKDIERFLKDDDSEYFRRALVCESQNYGIGAYCYYRRVVENSIGKILKNIRSLLERQDSSSEKIEIIDRALKGTVMDERIKIAKDALPNNLMPNSINPLAIIYDTLSRGIHKLPEEECLKNSQNLRVALSHLIKTLSQQNEEQTAFLQAIKNLNDFNSKSS
jgi:hypothetical protein